MTMTPKAKSLVELSEKLRNSNEFSVKDLSELERSMAEALDEVARSWGKRYHKEASIGIEGSTERLSFSWSTRNRWAFVFHNSSSEETLLTNCPAQWMILGIRNLPELEKKVIEVCSKDKDDLLDAVNSLQGHLPDGKRKRHEKQSRTTSRKKRNRRR